MYVYKILCKSIWECFCWHIIIQYFWNYVQPRGGEVQTFVFQAFVTSAEFSCGPISTCQTNIIITSVLINTDVCERAVAVKPLLSPEVKSEMPLSINAQKRSKNSFLFSSIFLKEKKISNTFCSLPSHFRRPLNSQYKATGSFALYFDHHRLQ